MISADPSINNLLTRGVEEVIDKGHLVAALKGKKKLRVKLGIDPTSPNIHIGRAGALWMLRAFQELGHKVIFIAGDFTGLIGDTSDKDAERPMLTETQVKENIKTYFQQASKIIDPKKSEMHYNSKWLKKLGFLEIGKMANAFGLHEMASRENISRRMKAGKRVSFRELLYPIMQGYDSVAVKADVEIGGTDQRFNLLAGRVIQQLYGQKPQDIVTRTLMEGTDGRKMSSSWGNVINITDEPNEIFGKVMSVPDHLIGKYFLLAARTPLEEIRRVTTELKNPRDQKLLLAQSITSLYHGNKAAADAKEAFIQQFTRGEVPHDLPVEFVPIGIRPFSGTYSGISGMSKSQIRRLIDQGAVEIDGKRLDKDAPIKIDFQSKIVKVGRKYLKIKGKK